MEGKNPLFRAWKGCQTLNPENTVPDPHDWRYAKSVPPQIAIEQNRRTERKKNKMGTKKMKLKFKIVFRINCPPPYKRL